MENREAIMTLQAHVVFACEKAGLSKAAVKAVEDALDMAISALEKQEAKPAEMSWDINFGKVRPHCPVCRESNPMEARYCFSCGQRIKTEES